jgi:crotonobetainyl-CoA:carnitine CoA-transferase CaiB-like acyl-CoA transferase
MPNTTPGALDGVVIADFGRVLAAPYATMLLADLGADVIKIERPGSGDETRAWGPPFHDDTSTYFLGLNRNKRSVSLDLTDPDDAARAFELASTADVVVENFRPGTMERHGLGYDRLAQANPRLVYCSVTGFGREAGRDLPGYDLLVQAVGGLMSITGDPDGEPTKVGVAMVDVVTGMHAAVGILAALRHRDATGQGQRIDVSLLTSLLSALVNQSSAYVTGGVVPTAMGNRHPSIAPYELLPTADRPIAVAVGNDTQFAALAAAVGAPWLATDARYRTNSDRVAHRDGLAASLALQLAERGADDWVPRLSAAGVPAGPVNDIAQAFDLATRLGLSPVVDVGGDIRQVANPIGLSVTPAHYRRPPPRLGQHNAEDSAPTAKDRADA